MSCCSLPFVVQCMLCLLLTFLYAIEAHRHGHGESRSFFEAQRRGIRHKRKMVDSVFLWPNKTVPYTFLDPPPDRAAVLSGVQHWQQHTCLKFVHTSDLTLPHVAFRRLSGCRSGVGRELPLGQNVSIGDTCTRLGIVVHEIGHAIGFYHEIRRPDRDQHVIINSGNILKEELFNFHKLQWIDTSVQYDLSSVMHYTPMEWTANGRTSVATKDPMLQGVLGMWKGTSHRGLSHRDKLLANTVYDCIGTWVSSCGLETDPCEGEGYMGPSCICICPPGTAGSRCQHSAGGYYDDLLSPCSQTVSYDTVIRSPNYPYKYDKETWCVWVLHSDQCRAPVLTIQDFDFGPRDSRQHCTYDYLEIRTNSSSDGEVKCEKEVTPGTEFRAMGHTMILYFNGELGGYRGFEARLKFENIPGCCRKIVNGTETHWLSPGYPEQPKAPFKCTVQLHQPDPAKLEVYLQQPKRTSEDEDECPLELCLPDGTCSRHCSSATDDGPVAVLPNSGSVHTLSGSTAILLTVKAIPTPCHQVIEIGGSSDSAGAVEVLATSAARARQTMCEYRFQSTTHDHVKLVVQKILLSGNKAFLAVDEGGSGEYYSNTTRSYSTGNAVPHEFISANSSIAVTLQGGAGTHLTLQYYLYECEDEEEECQYWKLDGECERNWKWMSQHCPVSCLTCNVTSTCGDRHQDCQFWAQHGQCEDNDRWMAVHCTAACGHCPACEDRNPQCGAWAAAGECHGNAPYMQLHCPNTCKFCDGLSQGNDTSPKITNQDVTDTSENSLSEEVNSMTQIDEHDANVIDFEISSLSTETQNSPNTNKTSVSGKLKEPSNNATIIEINVNGESVEQTELGENEKFVEKSTESADADRPTMNEVEENSLLENFAPVTSQSPDVVNESTTLPPPLGPEPTAVPIPPTPLSVRPVNAPRLVKRFRNFHRQTQSLSGGRNRRFWTTRKPSWGTGNKDNLNRTLLNRHRLSKLHPLERSNNVSHFKSNSTYSLNSAYKLKKNESNIFPPSHFNDVTFGMDEHPLSRQREETDDQKRVPFSLENDNTNFMNRSEVALRKRKYRKRWPFNFAHESYRNRSSKLIGNQKGMARLSTAETVNKTSSNFTVAYTKSSQCFNQNCSENLTEYERNVNNTGQSQVSGRNSTFNNEKQDFLQHSNDINAHDVLQSKANYSSGVNSSSPRYTQENETLPVIYKSHFDADEIDEMRSLDHSTELSTSDEEIFTQQKGQKARNSHPLHFEPKKKGWNQNQEIEGRSTVNQHVLLRNPELAVSVHPARKRKFSRNFHSQNPYKLPRTSSDNFSRIFRESVGENPLSANLISNLFDSSLHSPTSSTPKEPLDWNASEVNSIVENQSLSKLNVDNSLIPPKIDPFSVFTQRTTSSPATTTTPAIPTTLDNIPHFDVTTNAPHRDQIKPITNESATPTIGENLPAALKLVQVSLGAGKDGYGNRRLPPRAYNYSVVGRGLRTGNLSRRKQAPRVMSAGIYSPRQIDSTENDVSFPVIESPTMDNHRRGKQNSRYNDNEKERPRPLSSNAVSESAMDTDNGPPSDVVQKRLQNLPTRTQPTNSYESLWTQKRRRLVSQSRSRRNYIRFIKAFKNKEAVIDSFMMLPFCSDIKRSRRRAISSLRSTVNLNNHIKYSKKSYRRRLKLYRMLKRILNPKFPTGVTQNEPVLNWYFKNKLRRTLRRLYRMRKEKLRQYLFFNQNSSSRHSRRHGKKKKLKRYIRKYHLHKIFKLYKIRMINTHFDGFRNTSGDHGSHSPVVCIAIRKSRSPRRKQITP